jgi:hypothetical protein
MNPDLTHGHEAECVCDCRPSGSSVAFAEPHGCADACRKQGVEGLLRVLAVRLCVGVALFQIYPQVFGTRGQPNLRRPARGDGYDVWHVILSSTADVFVTFDRRLAEHVERIPDVPVRVAGSAKDLLAAIRAATSPTLSSTGKLS